MAGININKTYKKTLKLYVENEIDGKTQYYYDEEGHLKRFYAWGVLTTREYINGIPTPFARHEIYCPLESEEQVEFIKWSRGVSKDDEKKVYIDQYNGMKIDKDVSNPKKGNIVVYCTVGTQDSKKQDPNKRSLRSSGAKIIKIGAPLYSDNMNYEEFFERIIKMDRGQLMVEPLPSFFKVVNYNSDRILAAQDVRRQREEYLEYSFYDKVYGIRDIAKDIAKAAKNVAYYVASKVTVKRLAVCATVVAVVLGGHAVGKRLYNLEKSRSNGFDCLEFDENFASGIDQELRLGREKADSNMKSLAGVNDKEVSYKDREETLDYAQKFVGTNFDNNKSENHIHLSELVKETGDSLQESQKLNKQRKILGTLENRYRSCFNRPNNVEVSENPGEIFLETAVPYSIFTSGKYKERQNTEVPSNFDSSMSKYHPTSEDIRLFNELPAIDKYIVACQAIEIYKRCPNYKFVHAAYVTKGKSVLESLYEARDEAYYNVLHDPKVPSDVKIQLMASESDRIIETNQQLQGKSK